MNADEMVDRLTAQLSRRRRLADAAALVAGLTGAAFVVLLWSTEPDLPTRTHVAFAGLTALGLGWAGYGSWALARRTPLFVVDRVVTAWLALGATVLLVGGTVVLRATAETAPVLPVVLAALLLVAAAAHLARVRARRAALVRRRDALRR